MALAETPAAVLDVFRVTSEALANQDPDAFLEPFDRNMPNYAKLRTEVEELLAVEGIGTTIDVITDAGDDQMRDLELDWLLKIGSEKPRRHVVKVHVERHGKKWKITALEPVEFFRK